MKTTITKLVLLFIFAAAFTTSAQPPCQASFTAALDSTGYGVILTNTSSGAFTNVQWSFGDGTGSAQMNPVHYYNTNGTVQICLTVYDSAGPCQSAFCDTITVGNPMGGNCNVNFGYQGSGLTLSFNAYVSAFSQATYSWDFGDGSGGTGQFIQHSFAAAGTYTVCVTAVTAAGCTSTFCNAVTVGLSQNCNAFFSWNVTGTVLNTVQFTEMSSGDSTWFWNFGDGSTSAMPNPMHSYAAPGTYYVCLTINDPASLCTDTYCDSITVGINAGCNAMFSYQNVQMLYSFSTLNTPGSSHYWSFGDGTFSFAPNPTHTYGSPGTYAVCHTVTDSGAGCTDTWCDSIVIGGGGNCTVSYTYITDSTGTIYTFTATASGVFGQFMWSFGDGTAGSGPVVTHSYNSTGNYVVCVSLVGPSGGVLCSFCDSIAPGNPSPCIPVFYSYADSTVLGNGNVNFGIYNPCSGSMQLVWDFGDGSTGSGLTPSHVYNDSGWYYVCVTAYTGVGTFTYCDSVYAFRLSTGINDINNVTGLNVYPNPADNEGIISFMLLSDATVQVRLTDLQGRMVMRLYEGHQGAGMHKISFNASSVQSGMYLVQLHSNGQTVNHRIAFR